MKKYTYFLISLILVFFTCLLFFSAKELKPINAVKSHQLQVMNRLDDQLNAFLADVQQKKEQKQLLKDFKQARISYKKAERFISYFDGPSEKNINAAPVTTVWYSAPYFRVIEPNGFQVIEEMILEDEISYTEIEKELKELNFSVKTALENQEKAIWNDRNVFEAARYEIIRVLSKGITGFDSPGILYSIPEAKAILEDINRNIALYTAYKSTKKEHKALVKKLNTELSDAIRYLKNHTDFSTFNRMEFIKEYLNPIYGDLYELQTGMHVFTINDVASVNQSINYQAKNIFSEDFLNPYFYSESQFLKPNKKYEELGKILFFDPILSENNERSCSSCHLPEKGFADGMVKSTALNFAGTVSRNAPTLLNSAYQSAFFLDMRAPQLENQVAHVVLNRKEFHMDYKILKERLLQSQEYVQLFEELKDNKVKGADAISLYAINEAISMYIRSLKSFNSPFDKYVRGESEVYPEEAIRGFNLFMGKANCGACHFAPVFNGTAPPYYHETEGEVLGVPADKKYTKLDVDEGRFALYKDEFDKHDFLYGAFKTTTIRNIELTAPYMHNGVFETLEEVLEFYNNGGGIGHGLEVPEQSLSSDSLHLSENEISDIIVFMKTLTDTTNLTSRPKILPEFESSALNERKIGGVY